jgi:hypothetical protein
MDTECRPEKSTFEPKANATVTETVKISPSPSVSTVYRPYFGVTGPLAPHPTEGLRKTFKEIIPAGVFVSTNRKDDKK